MTHVDDGVDTRPLLKGLSTSTDEETVEQGLCGEKTLVLEAGDLEVDVIVAVALLGSFTFNKPLRLQGKELGLNSWVIGRKRS